MATRSNCPRAKRCARVLSPYAAGKLAGEAYVAFTPRRWALMACPCIFNIFGPRQDPSSPYSGVISLFLKAMTGDGGRTTIYGDGGQLATSRTCMADPPWPPTYWR